jgi:hypothetical protein
MASSSVCNKISDLDFCCLPAEFTVRLVGEGTVLLLWAQMCEALAVGSRGWTPSIFRTRDETVRRGKQHGFVLTRWQCKRFYDILGTVEIIFRVLLRSLLRDT